MMKVISMMGKAGSGKSTASRLMAELLEYKYISTGELARKHLQGIWIELGAMAPEKKMRQVFESAVEEARNEGYYGLVVDGMPRKMEQVKYMLDLFKNDKLVWVELQISDEASIERLLARRRVDDTDEAISNRLTDYKLNQTGILSKLSKYGQDIHFVNAECTQNELINGLFSRV